MTCVPGPPQFRLLDPIAGWEADTTDPSIVVIDPAGLRLKGPEDLGTTADLLSRFIPPPWFVRGNGPLDWQILGDHSQPSMRTWKSCWSLWSEELQTLQNHKLLKSATALSIRGSFVAISDAKAKQVFIWSRQGGRLLAQIVVDAAGPIAFSPWGELIVAQAFNASAATVTLARFDLGGAARSPMLTWKSDQPIQRLAAGRDQALWVATGPDTGPFRLDRIVHVPGSTDQAATLVLEPLTGCDDDRRGWFGLERNVKPDRLPLAFCATGLSRNPRRIFCLEMPDGNGSTEVQCFTRDGQPAQTVDADLTPTDDSNISSGVLLTKRLDSGIPRCQWHRVQLDADIPDGAEVVVEVATMEDPEAAPQSGDWEIMANPRDALVAFQPAGRYLFVRITLRRSAQGSPVIRRVRLDFPRSTSLDRLPSVYRDNPDAEDFTARFLGLFDATIADVDRAIETFASLLDTDHVPEEVLVWLGSMFGVSFDPSWSPERRRALIKALPELEQKRGTVNGLKRAIELLFDLTPAIQERSSSRSWGAVGRDARLGSVRLFGKARTRFRLGQSVLGIAPLRSYGNPDLDPFRDEAYRFNVLVPSTQPIEAKVIRRLDQLISEQKPGHTQHTLRVGGSGLVIGPWSTIEIDTRLAAPDRPRLGSRMEGKLPGNVKLNRMSILRPGSRARPVGLSVGQTVLGISTVLE